MGPNRENCSAIDHYRRSFARRSCGASGSRGRSNSKFHFREADPKKIVRTHSQKSSTARPKISCPLSLTPRLSEVPERTKARLTAFNSFLSQSAMFEASLNPEKTAVV